MSLLEIKLDKLRGKTGSNEIQISKLKKAEIAKCNEYCKISLAMFGHFTQMYAHTKDRTSQQMLAHYETLPLHELLTTACREPDLSKSLNANYCSYFYYFDAIGLISEEEVRPFLNGHFLSCRIMSKIIPAEAFLPSNDKSIFLVACLRRYEWLAKFAPMLCERRGVNIADVFGEELKICNEMKALLPSKIDRMCFLGEDGLSL